MPLYKITFNTVPGSYGTKIEYRKSNESVWITPTSPPNPTSLSEYYLTLDDGFTYYVRLSAYGGKCTSKYAYITVNTGGPFSWRALDIYCQQGSPLSPIADISGFADPYNLGYDTITGRMYVVDSSAITQGSNIYWFDPNTITVAGDVTPVGAINVAALASIMDMPDRKIYITGANTSGLIVYNIATNTVSNVTFGTNGAYARMTLEKSGDTILSLDAFNLKATVISAGSLTVTNSINYSSIPNYTQRFSQGVIARRINGEWWIIASQGSGLGVPASSIARYNNDFSVLLGTIALPGNITWTNSAYWRSATLLGNILFVYDAGSNQLMTVNTNTLAVNSIHTFTNRQGKTNSYLVVTQDPVSFELYASGSWTNDANTDVNPIPITYKLDSSTYEPNAIYPAISYGRELTRFGNTDTLIGTYAGVVVYPSNPPGAATDGQINIFDKSSGADNTGYVVVSTLEEYNVNTGDPTGVTKMNTPSDPDYIPPYVDVVECPPTYDMVCPTATFTNSTREYEYSLKPSTATNPAIDHIVLQQVDTVTSGILANTTVPLNLYQNGVLTKIGPNPNRVDLLFKDAVNVTLATCSNLFTLT